MLNKKKGETIIEVVVALAILSLILVGIYLIILGVTNVAVASRNRTEATVMGQKGVNLYTRQTDYSCSIAGPATPFTSYNSTDPDSCPGTQTELQSINNAIKSNDASTILATLKTYNYPKNNDPCYYVEVVTPLTAANAPLEYSSLGTTDAANFSKVISHVVWIDKQNNVQDVQVSEIVRK